MNKSIEIKETKCHQAWASLAKTTSSILFHDVNPACPSSIWSRFGTARASDWWLSQRDGEKFRCQLSSSLEMIKLNTENNIDHHKWANEQTNEQQKLGVDSLRILLSPFAGSVLKLLSWTSSARFRDLVVQVDWVSEWASEERQTANTISKSRLGTARHPKCVKW